MGRHAKPKKWRWKFLAWVMAVGWLFFGAFLLTLAITLSV